MRKLAIVGVIAAVVLMMAGQAGATAEIEVISGGQTDLINPATNGTVTMPDGWSVTLSYTANPPGPGFVLDLGTITVSGPTTLITSGAGQNNTLEILLSGTGFTASGTAVFDVSGSSIGNLTVTSEKAYYSTTNSIFAETTQIGSTLGPYSSGFNATTTGTITSSSYSLTEDLLLTATSSGANVTASLDSGLTVTPEPGTLLLVGAGMVGLTVFRGRRKKA